jgi:hypothetical protein
MSELFYAFSCKYITDCCYYFFYFWGELTLSRPTDPVCCYIGGHAIVQLVSHLFLPVKAQGFLVGKVALGLVFLLVLFSPVNIIPMRPLAAAVPKRQSPPFATIRTMLYWSDITSKFHTIAVHFKCFIYFGAGLDDQYM